jgi:hypothetical protein
LAHAEQTDFTNKQTNKQTKAGRERAREKGFPKKETKYSGCTYHTFYGMYELDD